MIHGSPGLGHLRVSEAGFLSQATQATPPTVESPLPGGIAVVVRFFLNLPVWVQIAGFLLGAAAAVVVLVVLWRRRVQVVTWVRTRPHRIRIALVVAAGVVVLGAAGFGAGSWNYMQHNNGFCTGCHVMGPAYARFTKSEHNTLSCHACHQQSIVASMRQLYLWVAERPAEIGPHAKVQNAVCAKCHITGEKEVWQRIASTAGHRTHLESTNSALKGVQCVTCHGVEVHHFAPLDKTCAQSGCHDMNTIALGKMRGQTALHCTTCHRFTAEVPQLATRDSAAGTLVPGEGQCFSCHEMRARVAGMNFDPSRDPHRGACGMCHNPHRQESPAAARATCTTAGCHDDWRKIPFHIGLQHRSTGQSCTLCHLPHQARVDPSDCSGCHAAVRERARDLRVKPPLPFDTTRVGGISATAPGSGRGPKGKGDAAPPEPPWRPAVSPAPRASPDSFPHDRHRTFACITCHVTQQTHGRLTFTAPRGCQTCHHDPGAGRDCAVCHAADARAAPRTVTVRVTVAGHEARARPVEFRHGAHEAVRCTACHTERVTLDPGPPAATCQGCHDDHHAAARQCRTCHGGADPRAAHATLGEIHVACDACHAGATVAGLTPDRAFCQTCHVEQQSHHVEQECTVCHFLSSPEEFRAHLRKDAGEGDR